MYAMMQCKAKSENLTHILGYQIWAVTIMIGAKSSEDDNALAGLNIPSKK